MPFLRIDTEGQVNLDVFDASNIARNFPWKLGVGMPCFPHGQECSVSYCLRVCGDAIMLSSTEVYMLRAKTRKDFLDSVEIGLGGTMFYQDLCHHKNTQKRLLAFCN